MVGKDLLIAVGGVIVAAQRSCTLNMDVDTIEVCSPVDGAWKKHIPTTIGWQVQCAGLIYNPEHADALIEAISKREMVRISFYDPELRMLRSGYAIMTTLEEGGSIGDMASQSMQFLGSGELEKVEAVDMDAEGGVFIQSYPYDSDDNHAIHIPASQMMSGVILKTITVESYTRLKISATGITVLYKEGESVSDIQGLISGCDNIRLYKNEETHVVSGEESVLLSDGVYVIGCNTLKPIQGQDYGVTYSLTAVSIPVN